MKLHNSESHYNTNQTSSKIPPRARKKKEVVLQTRWRYGVKLYWLLWLLVCIKTAFDEHQIAGTSNSPLCRLGLLSPLSVTKRVQICLFSAPHWNSHPQQADLSTSPNPCWVSPLQSLPLEVRRPVPLESRWNPKSWQMISLSSPIKGTKLKKKHLGKSQTIQDQNISKYVPTLDILLWKFANHA